MTAPLLAIRNLSIRFPGMAAATVEGVDLDIGRGETVGLVGESGSGKSVLAQAVIGIADPAARVAADRLELAGADLVREPAAIEALRGSAVAMIFQNPRAALDPIRTAGRHLADMLRRHRAVPRRGLGAAVTAGLAAVRIADPARRAAAYPFELSGGMCQRVLIAMALAGEPELLIADEPTTGLDATTQAAILDLIAERATARRMATLLITHDLALARQRCDRIAVMHAGHVVEAGAAGAVLERPRHPYTARLVAATPARARSIADLAGVPGSLPDLRQAPPACRFADRCDRADPGCRTTPPPRRAAAGGLVACHHPL